MVLTREQIVATNWIGGCLLVALIAVVAALVIDSGFLLLLAGGAALLILPLSGAFSCPVGWPRGLMAVYIAVLAVIGVVAAYYAMHSEASIRSRGIGLASAYVLGVFLSGWVVNALMFVRVRR
jgi:hypothetical protein